MKREEQIRQAGAKIEIKVHSNPWILFEKGAQWADAHPNWIAVEDELPPKKTENSYLSNTVIVCNDNGSTTAHYNHYMQEWVCDGVAKYDVTHWMPLPVPPRKEDNKDE